MSAVQPVALYTVQVPPGGVLIPAAANVEAAFRVTIAAIDPEQEPHYEDEAATNKPARATLKIVRIPALDDSDDEDDEDYSDEENDLSEEDSDEDDSVGPSDPAKAKKARQAAKMADAMDEDDDEEESGDDDEVDLKSAISKLIKGKGKATDDDDDSVSDEGLDLEETVICTLNPDNHCQQTLDFTVNEDERIMFKVTGTHTVYVTGNYIMPADPLPRDDYDSEDDSEDDEEDYDSDELDMMDEDDSESDELDDLENPRVQEITSEDEKEEQQKSKKDKKALPAAEEKKDKKGKNKRPAEEENLDEMISKEDKKKVKKNDGKAAPVEEKKKVQFAKNLEQGPTPSPPVKNDEKKPATPTVREVQGVLIDDRKIGTGKVAKKGNTVAMRYIGKLENGKVFDSNKSGKPFSFKLGSGEVIKGWDIGVPGMSVGGERRITIPAHLAYGKRGVPGIPPNATLKFDIKLISIK
ncbi:FK506-binding protein [Ascosphaera apis ARSEF 7405]|uniref:FK506-binding protein n=1 Tax=Ascosphaera apis ARSEF 7405 TaxID=392613 RepID=A0A167V699_9EURO|nr:FK506-binding protein [Ascosphaera apis ARSEF 7405]